MQPVGAIRRMFGGRPGANALLYVSMGLMSPLIALTYREGGPFALVAFFAPLGIARLSFVQYQRLQEASSRMEAKDQAILKATELVGAERRDERLAIAGELHDEVLPPLFKVHLMGQVLRRDIESGHLLELDRTFLNCWAPRMPLKPPFAALCKIFGDRPWDPEDSCRPLSCWSDRSKRALVLGCNSTLTTSTAPTSLS